MESFGAKKKSLRHAAVVNTCCDMRKMLSKPADVKDLQILEKITLLCSGCVPLTSYDASLRSNLSCEQFGTIGSTIYKDLKLERLFFGGFKALQLEGMTAHEAIS